MAVADADVAVADADVAVADADVAVADAVLLVDEEVAVDEAFVLEDAPVAPVPGAWYISSRFGPPQYSDELPLQGISQPVKPSGAGPPPPVKVLPQSLVDISIIVRIADGV